jgi:hypothetical protein
MSAVATKKYSNDALNLGFPTAYRRVTKDSPREYFPEVQREAQLYVGNDDAQQLREDRKRDADYMAKARVLASRSSTIRYLTTAHGAGAMPPAYLGQRKFANPTFGFLSGSSARLDTGLAPFAEIQTGNGQSALLGGVLSSAQGQQHGKTQLMARVAQLNAIESAKDALLSGQQAPATGTETMPTQEGQTAMSPLIELNFLLQGIEDAVISGIAPGIDPQDEDEGMMEEERLARQASSALEGIGTLSRGTFESTRRAMLLLFRLAPILDAQQLAGFQSKMESILQNLDGMLDPDQQSRFAGRVNGQNLQSALSIQVLFTRLVAYVREMIGGVNLQPRERLALSKALVKQLKFERGLKYGTVPDYDLNLVSDARQNAMKAAQDEALFTPTGRFFRPDPYEGYEGETVSGYSGQGRSREDAQHPGLVRGGNDVIEFDADGRQTYGYNAGDFYPSGGRDAAWFGEMLGNTVRPGGQQLPDQKYRVEPKGSGRRKGRAEQELALSSHFDPDLGGWNVKM